MNATPSFTTLPRMRTRGWLLALALACAGTASAEGPGLRHEWIMRGQVLDADASGLVVCVGERDGAAVGQELDVVRHVRVAGGSKKAGPRYKRESVGRVRITGLFDEHYAEATVVTGSPRANDTVELVVTAPKE